MTDHKISPAPEGCEQSAPIVYPDLKASREAKGLSLRDIYERTRISVVNLEAIEKGQFHRLPAPVYARPFIRSYALIIGVGSEILLDAYERHLQSLNNRRQQEYDTEGARRKSEGRYKPAIWLLSAATAVVIIILTLAHYNQPGPEIVPVPPASPVLQAPDAKPAETSPPPIAQPQAPPESSPGQEKTVQTDHVPTVVQSGKLIQARAPVIPAGNIPEKSVQPEIPTPASEKNYHLFMEARETVWLRIRDDRNRSEQIILKAGETLERFAAKSFTIDIGNAGGIDITFQGKPVGSPGKRGQVVHLRFP